MDIRAERIDGDIRLWLSGKSILIPVDSAPAMLEELYKEEGRSVTALGDLAGLGRDTRVKVIKRPELATLVAVTSPSLVPLRRPQPSWKTETWVRTVIRTPPLSRCILQGLLSLSLGCPAPSQPGPLTLANTPAFLLVQFF